MSDKGDIDSGNALVQTENAPISGERADDSSLGETVKRPRKQASVSPAAASVVPKPRKSIAPTGRVSSGPKSLAASRGSIAPKSAASPESSAPKASKRASKAPAALGASSEAPAAKASKTRRATAITLPSAGVPAPVPAGADVLATDVRAAVPAATPANVMSIEPSVIVHADDQISIPPATSDVGEEQTTAAEAAIAPVSISDAAARATVMALRPAGSTVPDADASDAYEAQLAARLATERRAKSQKYVKAVVGIAAVVCLAAVARVGFARFGHPPEPVAMAAVSEPAPAAAAQPADEQAAEPQAEPVAEPPVEQIGDKTAGEEKKAALGALEKRKLEEAIAAGERSVALDPSDGDAWRILGAAYQDSGRIADARRCYSECTKHGKKGEIRECTFLLSK